MTQGAAAHPGHQVAAQFAKNSEPLVDNPERLRNRGDNRAWAKLAPALNQSPPSLILMQIALIIPRIYS
jgi:hypothetical protein